MKIGHHSGLVESTLKKYANSSLMEFSHESKDPFYMHARKCGSGCEFGCNGDHGFAIAKDIIELQIDFPKK